MLLATGSSFDFMQFFQILCWIVIPAFLIAAAITVYFHYKKKKKENDEGEEEKLVSASPELVGYTKGDGEFICFDHSTLISEYKHRLSFNHARYTALRHDFEKLEIKYAGLAHYASVQFSTQNSTHMEQPYEQMPGQMQEDIQQISNQFAQEKEELLARLQQMNQAYTSLEEENESLTDQLKLRSANEEEGQIVISKWKEENDQLKEKVAEQEYIRDVLQEKKLQIEFLQNQLEQRIKTNHLDEYQKSQLHSEIDRLKQVHGDDLKKQENLEAAYQQRNEEVEKLQTVLNDREQQLAEKQSLLASKLDRITRLENELHEATGKNEQLNHKMNESNELIARLQAQVSAEQLKAEEFEQKYLLQRQSLQRMHSDISLMVEGETSPSPVIPLRPEYLTREADEIAVH